MAKIDLIKQIMELNDSYSEKELEKKTNKELNSILESMQPMEDEDVSEKLSKSELDDLKDKMYQEVVEQVKKELKNEPTNFVEETEEKTQSDFSIPAPKKKRKEQIDKSMLVPIMNVTNGKLIYQSKKSGFEFIFEKYGDIEYIEVYELLTMRSSQRRFLHEPYIVVLDEEVSNYLGLSKLYKKLTHATEIDKIFKLDIEKMREVVESAPRGLAHLIVSRAKEKIHNGSLDSVQRIELLEQAYKVELNV